METIKVNMTPCEDIKTIHASQNDNEAREWGFELHNNGELIDTSEITEQLFFKACKGGTEQILPENTSTPTTSPFKGDIRYPQGLLTDQEFLYRESPTEEDGLAKITDIKGNTLKWNQLQPNNISRTNNGVTYTYDNGKLTVTGTATSTSWWLYGGLPVMNMKANHKYLFVFGEGMADSSLTTFKWYLPNSGQILYTDAIITINKDVDQYLQLQISSGYTIDAVFYPQVFDLTQMFGAGKEPATVEEFTSFFGNLFYAYNAGTLLSFNGTGLKTTGKNLLDPSSKTAYDGENGLRWYQTQGLKLKANKTYTFSASNTGGLSVALYIVDHATRNTLVYAPLVTTYTPTQNVIVYLQAYRGGGIPSGTEFQLEIGSQTSYEPYTSSTLSLPISTYFPTGMKSKGDIYDELTETKAITRIGSRAYQSGDESDTSVITDGTTTYYALATPTETSFTTASLVTENAEIPLSNEDGVLIGKCTEELSAEPGFHDAKIKLSDADGECYSNKLQLHVERSPQ